MQQQIRIKSQDVSRSGGGKDGKGAVKVGEKGDQVGSGGKREDTKRDAVTLRWIVGMVESQGWTKVAKR